MKPSNWFLKTLIILAVGILVGFLIAQAFEKPKKSPTPPKYTGQVLESKSEIYSPSPNAVEGQTAKVVRVIDGDTVEIEGGQKIRYIGIDTPEIVDPRKSVQCFGLEASNKNKELVEGRTVELEKDVSETDKYGRLLRYVYLPAEASAKAGVDDVFVNDYLVRQGYAHASSYPPDIKYQSQLQQAEEEARQNNRGLWATCQNQSQAAQTPQLGIETACPIKGNISSSGEKIYHMPGQRYYDKTVIDETKGERWFCSEDEAIASGWRKSKI